MPDTACRVPTKNPICRDGILAVRNLYLIPNLIINRQYAVRHFNPNNRNQTYFYRPITLGDISVG